MHKIVAGKIIINSVRSKFDPLLAAFAGNIDILLITETKIDTIFPKDHTRALSSSIYQNMQKYENIILTGDNNAVVTENNMQEQELYESIL